MSSIAQTKSGYSRPGTSFGPCSFDGVEFERLPQGTVTILDLSVPPRIPARLAYRDHIESHWVAFFRVQSAGLVE